MIMLHAECGQIHWAHKRVRGLRKWHSESGEWAINQLEQMQIELRHSGSIDLGCGVAFKELFGEALLDGGDKSLLGGLGTEGRSKWLEEESRHVHLLCECGL